MYNYYVDEKLLGKVSNVSELSLFKRAKYNMSLQWINRFRLFHNSDHIVVCQTILPENSELEKIYD